MINSKLIVHKELHISDASAEMPFDRAITYLKASYLADVKLRYPPYSHPHMELITAEELALVRVQAGDKIHGTDNSPVYYYGCWVNNSYIYRPDNFVFVTRGRANILLNHAEAITRAYEQKREAYVHPNDLNQLEILARDDPEEASQTGVLLLHRDNLPDKLESTKLGEDTLTCFLFGSRNTASQYGAYLMKHGKQSITHCTVQESHIKDKKHRGLSLGRMLAMEGFSTGFGLFADYHWHANNPSRGRVFGVGYSYPEKTQ